MLLPIFQTLLHLLCSIDTKIMMEEQALQQLPPGFRFHPTDEELLIHYLQKKVSCSPLPAPIITEIDLYKHDPWELPAKASYGEQEWYFFSPRNRKYPNGDRPNRSAGSGYWKATGTDKPIVIMPGTASLQNVGVKKSLVFYRGSPLKSLKTNWIMHEYRLAETMSTRKRKGSIRLDDWVLCRIYKKVSHSSRVVSSPEPEVSSPSATDLQHTQLNLAMPNFSSFSNMLKGEGHFMDNLVNQHTSDANWGLPNVEEPVVEQMCQLPLTDNWTWNSEPSSWSLPTGNVWSSHENG